MWLPIKPDLDINTMSGVASFIGVNLSTFHPFKSYKISSIMDR